MTPVILHLPDPLMRKLDDYATAWNRTRSDVVAELLRRATLRDFPVAWCETVNLDWMEAILANGDSEAPEERLSHP